MAMPLKTIGLISRKDGIQTQSIVQSARSPTILRNRGGYNNLMTPYYQPRLFIEEVDGKTILIIKVTAGERRPYQNELAKNGSPAATIETDDARTYFIIDIPCHPDFVCNKLPQDSGDVVNDAVNDVVKNLTERQTHILDFIKNEPTISAAEMSQRLNAASRTIQRDIAELQNLGVLERKGGRCSGQWIIKINR